MHQQRGPRYFRYHTNLVMPCPPNCTPPPSTSLAVHSKHKSRTTYISGQNVSKLTLTLLLVGLEAVCQGFVWWRLWETVGRREDKTRGLHLLNFYLEPIVFWRRALPTPLATLPSHPPHPFHSLHPTPTTPPFTTAALLCCF